MPGKGKFVPHKSGVHRHSCFALYRALLRQKRPISEDRFEPGNFNARIKAFFIRGRRLQGHARITRSLQRGYRALDDLEDPRTRPKILQFIARPFRWRHQATQDAPAQRKTPAKPNEPTTYKPSAGPLLSRPHRNISGRRHVPVLVNANRFPFLRIKKPQPASLSAIIRSTARTREKRLLRTEALKNERITSLDEQQWDEILENQLGVERDEAEKSVSWQGAIDDSIKEIRQRTDRAVKKRIAMAELMTGIVDKETALAHEERLQRQDKAHKVRKARRLKRQERDPAASGLPLDDLARLFESNDGAESVFDQYSNEAQTEIGAPHSKNVERVSFTTYNNTENGSDSARPCEHFVEPGFNDTQNPINASTPYASHNDSALTAPPSQANHLVLAAFMNGQSLQEALTGAGQRSQGRWSRNAPGENGWQVRNDHRAVYRPTINTLPLPNPASKPQRVRIGPRALFNHTKTNEPDLRTKDPNEADSDDAATERERILQERARRKEEKNRRKEEKARASEERARLHREARQRKKAAKLHEGSFAGRMKRWLRAHDLGADESRRPEHHSERKDSGPFADTGESRGEEAAKRQT